VIDSIGEAAARLQSGELSESIEALCETFGVKIMTIFGSAADPGALSPGDLDIGVQCVTDEVDVIGLTDALISLTDCDLVDLTVLNRGRPLIRAQALCGIGLYERTKGSLAVAQMAALAEMRDTAWLRRLDLERLAG
jgi:predicted nucleotidyltransferase